jgi:hypothetical protein
LEPVARRESDEAVLHATDGCGAHEAPSMGLNCGRGPRQASPNNCPQTLHERGRSSGHTTPHHRPLIYMLGPRKAAPRQSLALCLDPHPTVSRARSQWEQLCTTVICDDLVAEVRLSTRRVYASIGPSAWRNFTASSQKSSTEDRSRKEYPSRSCPVWCCAVDHRWFAYAQDFRVAHRAVPATLRNRDKCP